jgi:hypothetical protein
LVSRAFDGSAHARAGHAEDAMVMIALDAHGYGEVAQHPESIFSDVGMSHDLITPCGGRLDLSASSGASTRAEILSPQAQDG